MAVAAGKIPIVVPRESSRGEQIDDHQVGFARRVAELGLARVATTPDEIRAALAHDRAVVAQATPPSLADELHRILAEVLPR
jgi:UDP-N-acetylglucosamine transferase subunit ALG13